MKKIIFEKPNVKNLSRLGYTCVDMHVHSRYSDGFNRISTILKRVKKKNIGVSITDHNEIKGSLEASRSDVLVIPGIEVTSKERIDLLIYFYNFKDLKKFYDKEVKKYINKKEILSRINRPINDILESCPDKCLISLAHPFAYAYKNVARYLKKKYNRKILDIDAIEVLNGEVTRKRNLKALEWSNKFNKAITAGSDAHIGQEIGNVLTCCKADNDKNFLDQNKKKKQKF